MKQHLNRRLVVLGLSSSALISRASQSRAQRRSLWSAKDAHDALLADQARVIDVRTRKEWKETGVGSGIWPISMHEDHFPQRLFAAKDLTGGRDIGLICATGGRSAYLLQALERAGYDGYFDVAEGMLGSRHGPGWLAAGLPVVPMEAALASLPDALG